MDTFTPAAARKAKQEQATLFGDLPRHPSVPGSDLWFDSEERERIIVNAVSAVIRPFPWWRGRLSCATENHGLAQIDRLFFRHVWDRPNLIPYQILSMQGAVISQLT